MTYLINILIALSQLGNTILGGYPDESMSARAWRTGKQGKLPGVLTRPLIDGLFWFDPDHCRKAYENLMAGKHMPPDIRQSGA